jgi:hypothetical protein
VAGDWHGNLRWSRSIVRWLPRWLPDESPRVIVHAGDFGAWRSHPHFLDGLNEALAKDEAIVYFVDGNHEDHPWLHELAGTPDPQQPVGIRSNIIWLPRGYRWTWHARTWLALGGAVSVDRALRTEGWDWFPEETITHTQAQRIIADGRADVMICHDTPSSVPLRLPPPSRLWADHDLARSDRHREQLQEIVDAVQPAHLIHGHYHLDQDRIVEMRHGDVRITGLDCDGTGPGNYRLLDVRTMTYTNP